MGHLKGQHTSRKNPPQKKQKKHCSYYFLISVPGWQHSDCSWPSEALCPDIPFDPVLLKGHCATECNKIHHHFGCVFLSSRALGLKGRLAGLMAILLSSVLWDALYGFLCSAGCDLSAHSRTTHLLSPRQQQRVQYLNLHKGKKSCAVPQESKK